jgi:fatty aldehyde-generating acyl-ACP reductase
MDRQPAGLDFALIGHQDSWKNVSDFINSIRAADMVSLTDEQVRSIFPYIPPRDLFRITVHSALGTEVKGTYVETFISPDKLNGSNVLANIGKVKKAIQFAKNRNAGIVTLGGFTSILLEGNIEEYVSERTKFTTGNTLTAAFIAKGIESAAVKLGINMADSVLLVVGATGDIGMACTNYFKKSFKKVLLNARNYNRLQAMCAGLINEGIAAHCSTVTDEMMPEADVIIYVASSVNMTFSNSKKNVLVCDAGYPKNLNDAAAENVHLFHGGMGVVKMGYEFIPDYTESFYRYPEPYICHGCLLEAVVLAMEERYEQYSAGKGNITTERMQEIFSLASKHGIEPAPFFNNKGKW